MPIYSGSKKIKTLYYGEVKIKEAYYGVSGNFVKVYSNGGKVDVEDYTYSFTSGDLELLKYIGTNTVVVVPVLEKQ